MCPQERLQSLGSYYGALPAHEGLWESARATAGSLPARLAIESCVHEARGLDVLPQTISRFRAGGDAATANLLLTTVYPVRRALQFADVVGAAGLQRCRCCYCCCCSSCQSRCDTADATHACGRPCLL